MSVTFPEIQLTENTVDDIVKLIGDGNIVALFTGSDTPLAVCRIFHATFLSNRAYDPIEKKRVVYIDCNHTPESLKLGEWDWEIRARVPGIQELGNEDNLLQRIIRKVNVPNQITLSPERVSRLP